MQDAGCWILETRYWISIYPESRIEDPESIILKITLITYNGK